MAEIFLIRHGQASFDAENYDQLSALGEQQSLWLGQYFAERDIVFDQVFSGKQARHTQTLNGIAASYTHMPQAEQLSGLNEYDFESLIRALGEEHKALRVDRSVGKQNFYRALKKILILWQMDQLEGEPAESFVVFLARVESSLRKLQQSDAKRILVVSSGGPISAMVALALKAPSMSAIDLNLQIYNSSITRLYSNTEAIHVSSFNGIPHLDMPDKQHAVTYG